MHRARVHARAATDALERPPEVRSPELRGPAVIHQHDVKVLPAYRAVHVRGVDRRALSRTASREQSKEDRQLCRTGHELLDAHARDVDRRHRDAEVRVALVRADHDATCLRNREVHAGESRLRSKEPLAEVHARRTDEHERIVYSRLGAEVLDERLRDVLSLQVDRGRHDVARWLAAKLYDPLHQIPVAHVYSAPLEVRIEVAFLREHRLALPPAACAPRVEKPLPDSVLLPRAAAP